MTISAADFVAAVTGNGVLVPAGVVEGPVEIAGQTIRQSDWRNYVFNASVAVRDCRVAEGHDLDLRSATINGNLELRGVEFKHAGLRANRIQCLGNVILDGVRNSHATTEVVVMREGADMVMDYHGIDLVQARISGSLKIVDCSGWVPSAAIALDFAQIGTYARIGEGCTNFESLFLGFARIDGTLIATVQGFGSDRIVILDGLVAGRNASLLLGLEFMGKVLCRNATITGSLYLDGGGIQIAGDGRSLIDVTATSVGGELKICRVHAPVQVTATNARVGTFSLEDLVVEAIVASGLWSDGSITASAVATSGAGVDADFDLYGASCKAATFWEVSAKELDLSTSKVGSLLCIDGTVAVQAAGEGRQPPLARTRIGRIVARFAEIRGLYVQDVAGDVIELTGSNFAGYARFQACKFDRLVMESCSGGRLDMLATTSRATTLGELQYLDDFPGKDWLETLSDRNQLMDDLVGKGAVSCFGKIDLSGGDWVSVDLGHAYFLESPQDDEPLVDASNSNIIRNLKLRVTQFSNPRHLALLKRKDQMRTADLVLSIEGASVGQVDLGSPLPARIAMSRAKVASWGLRDETAAEYHALFSTASKFDAGQYLAAENVLEANGRREEADALHRMWRDELLDDARARDVDWFTTAKRRFHKITMGYGTQNWRLLAGMAVIWLVVTLLVIWPNYGSQLQVSPSVLATFKECQASCAELNPPELATTAFGRLGDSASVVARNLVPIVDLGLAPHIEAKADTWSRWILLLVRVLGWIAWPLFLTSVVSSLFPKRHLA